MTECQYFVLSKIKYIMHNIKTNFDIFHKICKKMFNSDLDNHGNFKFYSNKPKMSDIEIISLSVTMEALGIDSENYFFLSLQTSIADSFQI